MRKKHLRLINRNGQKAANRILDIKSMVSKLEL